VHELAVTRGMLEVALEAAASGGHRRVLAVDLVVGELSSMVDDSVQFYFDALSRGTAAEGARLRIRRTRPVLTCAACGHAWAAGLPLPAGCPACRSSDLRLHGGREFHVESIEVDDEDTGGTPDPEGE
jgi:hydrogenase nickel incorporation protein HypA/HybF